MSFGERDSVLRRVEELVECEVVVRGNEIELKGSEPEVEKAEAVFNGLVGARRRRTPSDAGHCRAPLQDRVGVTPAGKCSETWSSRIGAAGSRRRPETKRLTPMRSGVAKSPSASVPRVRGKTYLAVALAVEALNKGEVTRIILTRPAVEAGESLGFLTRRHDGESRPVLPPRSTTRSTKWWTPPNSRHTSNGV